MWFYFDNIYLSFYFLFNILIHNVYSSLLSRLKNRYEYIPLDVMKDLSTEDLYDFEYSTIREKISTSPLQSIEKNKSGDSLYDLENETDSNLSVDSDDNALYKRDSITKDFYYDFFVTRATIHLPLKSNATTTNKPKKTWPSYFPPKIVSHRRILGNNLVGTASKTNINFNTASAPRRTLKRKNIIKKITQGVMRNKVTIKLTNKTGLDDNDFSLRAELNVSEKTNLRKDEEKPSWCYRCGIYESGIQSPLCYSSFEGGDRSVGDPIKHHTIMCQYSGTYSQKRGAFYGPQFIEGCFKRFLDVGMVYNERGCRTKNPHVGYSIASMRLASMEKLLKGVNDGCVFSPHASLTPFSRAISLYARYHVCVCNSPYCNRSSGGDVNCFVLFLAFMIALTI